MSHWLVLTSAAAALVHSYTLNSGSTLLSCQRHINLSKLDDGFTVFFTILAPPDKNMFMRYNTTFIIKYPYSLWCNHLRADFKNHQYKLKSTYSLCRP